MEGVLLQNWIFECCQRINPSILIDFELTRIEGVLLQNWTFECCERTNPHMVGVLLKIWIMLTSCSERVDPYTVL